MLYGIKYLIKSIGEKIYILSPLKLVEGTTDNEKFYTNKEEQINLLSDTILEENSESYVVDKVVTASQLKEKYGEDDLDFLKDFYFESEKELLTLILILNNSLEKISINLLHLVNKNPQEIYTYIKSQPAVILNSDTLKEILEIGTIDLMY